jgi:hypothetical protein
MHFEGLVATYQSPVSPARSSGASRELTGIPMDIGDDLGQFDQVPSRIMEHHPTRVILAFNPKGEIHSMCL